LRPFEKLKARGGFGGDDRTELLKVERMLRTFAAMEKRLTVSGRSRATNQWTREHTKEKNWRQEIPQTVRRDAGVRITDRRSREPRIWAANCQQLAAC
jgi:hypothetical protein